LLLATLQSAPVRDLALERVLASIRKAFLVSAASADELRGNLKFCCALARQCFINEYVFATTTDEDVEIARRRASLSHEMETDAAVDPFVLALFACYEPLSAIAGAEKLLSRALAEPLGAVIKQQLLEPAQERELGASLARLTEIDDEISQRVRRQYEENPYPRWTNVAGQVEPVAIDSYLRELFPSTPFIPLGKTDALDILAAGCGTGWQAIGLAQKFRGARVLAVDLSLSSLAYAKRKTPPQLAATIEYAQADILNLAGFGRSFDLVDSSGVLHHMADPMRGWQVLLGLVRPGGLMHLAFYSELGRRDIVEARRLIARHDSGSTPGEIRRWRHQLAAELPSLTQVNDFFSTSECRDMLFHVQEHRLTIPQLKTFMVEHGLKFLGFEFDQTTMRRYRAQFSQAGWSMTDLDRWHAFEAQFPNTFLGMYHFWAQKG
jgi:SAM-dependent methyltransferase